MKRYLSCRLTVLPPPQPSLHLQALGSDRPDLFVAKPLTRWSAYKERLAALLYRLADWLSEDL